MGRDKDRRRVSTFSRRISSELCIIPTLLENGGRREDRVAAAPGALAQKKLRKRKNLGYGGDHTGLPRAMVLRLIRDLLGEPSRLPPSPSRLGTSAKRPSEDRGGMGLRNADFQNYASRIFLRADLERASTFDSAQQISIVAQAYLAPESACDLVRNGQSGALLAGEANQTGLGIAPSTPRDLPHHSRCPLSLLGSVLRRRVRALKLEH